MDINQDNINSLQSKPQRSIWWKIYFFIISFLILLGLNSFLLDPQAGIAEYLSTAIWLLGTIGLFGYVFSKPIFYPKFWFHTLVACIAYSAIYYFITDVNLRMGADDFSFYIGQVIGWVIYFPAFYGLYAYSKPEGPLWNKT